MTSVTTSTDSLRSPLDDRHRALGAKMSDFGGWSMPIEYAGGGVLKEHLAVREAVGVFDVSHLGKVRINGAQAAQFVNTVLTNDVGRIRPGQAQYSLLCNEDGGVIDDLIAYLDAADDVFLIPNAANTASVVEVLAQAAGDELRVQNVHKDFAVLAVQGPTSPDLMRAVSLPHEMPYMAFSATAWNDVPVRVCRTGYTGERGYELVIDAENVTPLWDALLDAGESLGVRPCGLGSRDTLRTEMGYPLHGQDISPVITPVQARLGWAIGWDKPTFHGRDALVAQRASGPPSKLWGLRARDRVIPRPHMSVTDSSGTVVGEVTSGTFSPSLRQGIGLALLAPTVAPGDDVQVDVRGRPAVVEVVKPPFVAVDTH